MVFSSIFFLFAFLPLVLGLYFLVPRIFKNAFLLIISLFFYFWGEGAMTLLMLLCIVINYGCGLLLVKANPFGRSSLESLEEGRKATWWERGVLLGSLVVNLGILALFKYFDFGLEAVNAALKTVAEGRQIETSLQFILPLGISFYTFQAMSYTLDVYFGKVKATRNLLNFATYVSLFPQLVAGPIVRYSEIAEELVSRKSTLDGFSYGILRFVTGLGKKVLFANTMGMVADEIYAVPLDQLTLGLAWLGLAAYTLQIYFDFSGYSDMAIGLGSMFGFTFPENFRHPYAASSVRDFWRRWHITLSMWFRDYLYIPLGGNRHGAIRTALALITVFVLCGLWHGASWLFILWGLYHGLFLSIERLVGNWKWVKAIAWKPLGYVYTILVVMGGWVLFRSENLKQAMQMYKALAGFGTGNGRDFPAVQLLTPDVLGALILGALFSLPLVPIILSYWKGKEDPAVWVRPCLTACLCLYVVGLLFLCASQLASGTHNPFIYFRF